MNLILFNINKHLELHQVVAFKSSAEYRTEFLQVTTEVLSVVLVYCFGKVLASAQALAVHNSFGSWLRAYGGI